MSKYILLLFYLIFSFLDRHTYMGETNTLPTFIVLAQRQA